MGSDKEKMEKKRLKAQVKAEKARAKAGLPSESSQKEELPPETSLSEQVPESKPQPKSEKIKWYKNPDWVRAIVAIITLFVMVITLLITIG